MCLRFYKKKPLYIVNKRILTGKLERTSVRLGSKVSLTLKVKKNVRTLKLYCGIRSVLLEINFTLF